MTAARRQGETTAHDDAVVRFAVRAEGFTYAYPALDPSDSPRVALDTLSCTIPHGAVVGLVGGSGSGLTTFCLALAGIVPHETGGVVRGRLEVAGYETTSVSPAELAQRVGIVFEDPEANLIGLTVAEEVAFALELAGLLPEEVDRRVTQVLDLVGLAALRERPVGQLSGGQKQRLALAVALARQPDLLVLDQPTAQLDPRAKADLFRALTALGTLAGKPLTVFLAERDTDFLLPLVERVLALEAGRLVLDASPEVAFTDRALLAQLGVPVPQLAELALALWAVPDCAGLPLFRGLADAVAAVRRCAAARRARAAVSSSRRVGAAVSTAPVAPGAPPLLRVEQVSFRYGEGSDVLRSVDLALFPGEVVAVVGPNGSGKTTLARHVIGALRPTRGRVLVAGQDTTRATVGELARVVGYVAQNPDHQLVRATPRAEVAFALRQLGLDEDDVERRTVEVLERFGLLAEAETPLPLLSRGRRQLVALAAAFARQPALLVLDEPTSALDESGRALLAELLAERASAGAAVLLVSHDLRFVARCAHRVVLLHEGRVRAVGSPREVLGDVALLAGCDLTPLSVTAVAAALGLPAVLEPDELVAAVEESAAGSGEIAPASDRPNPSPRTGLSPARADTSAAQNREPLLARVDPRVKLALALGGAVPLLLWESPLLLVVATVLLHALLRFAGGFSGRRLAAVWRALAPLLVLIVVLRPIFDRGGEPVLLQFGPLLVTLPGVLAAFAAALRVVALALLALAWFATTSERALVQSLVRLGLPVSVGLALAIGLRFIPVFAQTVATAAEALQTRGWIIPERGMARLRAYLPVLSVALAATLRQAQQLSWVLIARGVGARGARVRFGRLELRPRDRVLLVAGLALEAVLLGWTLLGSARSPLWPLE